MPCVGLVVLGGCLTFVIAPDEDREIDRRVAQALNPGLLTVVLDPGHGGRDDGAKVRGLVEKDLTLDVALRAEKLFQTYGFPTVLTRRDDSRVGLSARAEIGNRYENSVFISIHFNQSGHSPASGVETFYATEKIGPDNPWSWVGFFNSPEIPDADDGEALAGYIQAALVSRTEAQNRGIMPRPLHVVRRVRAPAVLVEGGFLSNAFDARLISTPEYRDRLAAAIVEGVISFQKTQPRPEPPAQLAVQ